MTTYYARGASDADLTTDDLRAALAQAFEQLGTRQRVLAVPPDYTRVHSHAGPLTCLTYEYYRDRLVDVLPALGTHFRVSDWQLDAMFPGLPHDRIRVHDWRRDVVTVGEVPATFVREVTAGIYDRPWPAQMNRLAWEGGHDLILSFGQVVPHEVIGMASYNKNIFIGIGGEKGINESHFISAVYGLERTLGHSDTPLRRILNYAQDHFCRHLPIVYALTVVGPSADGRFVVRGIYIGDDGDCFAQACALSRQVNFQAEDRYAETIVVYLDPGEFHSTWIGNKAIYRTRMLMAAGGELVIIAPGVETFGEDRTIDGLIRKYGYRPPAEVLQLARAHVDLQENLSAAAHLVHGSSEGRFRVTYAPGRLSREEVEQVGYQYADVPEMLARYPLDESRPGWNRLPTGQEYYFVRNPGLGLWGHRDRLPV